MLTPPNIGAISRMAASRAICALAFVSSMRVSAPPHRARARQHDQIVLTTYGQQQSRRLGGCITICEKPEYQLSMTAEGRPDNRQVEATASAIYLNLRRLQLYVTLNSYGPGFWEIFASTSPKMIVKAGNEKASGISLMLTNRYDPPELYIEEINSLRAGMGGQMVGAIIDALKRQPRAFQIRLNDRSQILRDDFTWWQHIISLHPEFKWVRTQF
jgi:hypothetical protein